MNKLFNIEDFDDFRLGMLEYLDYNIMTGAIPAATSVEEINAAADKVERALEVNAAAIYNLLPLDYYPEAGSLNIGLYHTLGGVKRLLSIDVCNVGEDEENGHFFAVNVQYK